VTHLNGSTKKSLDWKQQETLKIKGEPAKGVHLTGQITFVAAERAAVPFVLWGGG